MDPRTRSLYAARAKVLKALAHPTRLFMVEELSRGERCVCELRDMVGADISTVSKHLTQLREAGLVSDERRGSQVFYSLRAPCVTGFIGCIESVMQNSAQRAIELVKLQKLEADR